MIRKKWGGFLNVIQLGPFLLNFQLIIFIMSTLMGYLALKYRLTKANVEGNISEKFITALFIGFLTWKFSLVIFDPVSVIQYPASLLFFSGGTKGLWLAIVISIIFLWMRSRKDGSSILMNLDIMSTGWIVGSSTYHLLLLTLDSPNVLFHSLYISLMVGLLIILYKNKKALGNPIVLNQLVIWFSLGMIGIFFAVKERIYLIFSFSKEQIIFFVIFIIALLVGNALEKKKVEVI